MIHVPSLSEIASYAAPQFARRYRGNRRHVGLQSRSAAPPGPPSFVPPAGLAFWGDPSPEYVILNGDDLLTLEDRMGSGRVCTQGTAIDQPLWEAAGIGSHPSIHFNIGQTECLYSLDAGLADLPSGVDKPFTLIAYFQFITVGGSARIPFAWGRSSSTNPQMWLAQSSTNFWNVNKRDDANVQSNLVATLACDAIYHLHTLRHSGTAAWVYIDSVVTSINGTTNNRDQATFDRFGVGALVKSSLAGSNHCDMRLGQFFVFNVELSDVDRVYVQDYLTDLYAS